MSQKVRPWMVTGAAVFMMVGTLFGIGVFGTRVEESSGGALSATSTLLAPAVRAFSIWSVIYVGLIAYVVWQWLPRNAAAPRARAISGLAALSMVLNAAWLMVTQVGWLWLSVAVIIALVVVLGVLVRRLTELPTSGALEKIIMDGTFGLYLGWVSIATVANITATLVASGFDPQGSVAEYGAMVVLAVAALMGVMLAARLGGRLAVAAAMSWGLAWIAVGRLTTTPHSSLTAYAAIAAVLVILVATAVVRLRVMQHTTVGARHVEA